MQVKEDKNKKPYFLSYLGWTHFQIMKKLQRTVYLLLFIFLSAAGLYFARGFLIPLALAAVLALLLTGESNYLERKGMNRGISSLLSVLSLILIIGIVIFVLSLQVNNIMDNMSQMKERLSSMANNVMQWINEKLGITYSEQKKMIEEKGKDSAIPGALVSGLVNMVIIVVYMYLLLYTRTHIKKFILKLVPEEEKENALTIIHQSAKVIQKYLGGLGAMIVMLWVLYSIGFSIVGVENAIFFAILCGSLEIIPFIGNLIGTSVTLLAVLVQGGDSSVIIGVLITYGTIQFVQSYILEPLIVGKQVSINPLFTIIALVLGETIWGAAGMFLALPLLGIAKIICDHVPALQPYGFLIGTEKEEGQGIMDKFKKVFGKK